MYKCEHYKYCPNYQQDSLKCDFFYMFCGENRKYYRLFEVQRDLMNENQIDPKVARVMRKTGSLERRLHGKI